MGMISEAKTLVDLCDTLNALSSEQIEEQGFNGSDYPVFSTNEPKDTQDVWSYDICNVMVQDGYDGYAIEPRCQCCEASFHCICKQ